jgi:hypothetical protein
MRFLFGLTCGSGVILLVNSRALGGPFAMAASPGQQFVDERLDKINLI